MIEPTIKELILKDLDRLSAEDQRRALELVHNLVAPAPKGASVDELLSLSGTLDKESAREMREAVEEYCERIDPRDW